MRRKGFVVAVVKKREKLFMAPNLHRNFYKLKLYEGNRIRRKQCCFFFSFQLVTKAPADCMCRPCTAVEDEVMASEIAGKSNRFSRKKVSKNISIFQISGYSDPGSMMKSFIKI